MDFLSYLKGAFSGMVGILLSHPFDTIKTNMQAKKPIQYNPKFLYMGIKSPLAGIFVEKALVFGTYTNMHSLLAKSCNSTLNDIISGGTAGFCASFVVTPYERIKIMLQTNNKINRDLLKPKNLFKGLSATFTREIPGFSIYFSTYNTIERKVYGGKYTLPGSFLAGGISGSLAWCFIYPQDMIKTRIQSGISENQSFNQIIKNIYKEGGPRQFYRGFHFALMRAFPLHAGTFATMEMFKRLGQ